MYEIPKNLNKYEDEFIPFLRWNFRQFFFSLVLLAIVLGLYHFLPLSIIVKLPLIVIISLAGGLLIHAKADQKLISWANYKSSLPNVGYYVKKMEEFIPSVSIKDDAIFMKDGVVLAAIEVKPIDFSRLGTDEKEDALYHYRAFLRSLDKPLQIYCRSAEVNLKPWLANLKRLASENSKSQVSLERIEHLSNWIQDEITASNTRDRVFHIIVAYRDYNARMSLSDAVKEMLYMLAGKEPSHLNKRKIENEKSLKELSNISEDIIEKLEKTGVSAKRMTSDKLLSLNASIFTDLCEIKTSYLSPISCLTSAEKLSAFAEFSMKKVHEKLNDADQSHFSGLNIDEIDLCNAIKQSAAQQQT